VIVGDWCAHEDLCFAGWKVAKSEAHHFYDQQQGFVFIPQPAAIADRIEHAHTALWNDHAVAGYWHEVATKGAAPYQIDTVIRDHWLPLLSELERDIRQPRSRGVLRIIRREERLSRHMRRHARNARPCQACAMALVRSRSAA
jgi:hypothetical protein